MRPANWNEASEIVRTAGRENGRTLESKNLLVRMHNGRVGRYWPPEDIVRIGEVYDDDLVGFIDLFPNADEVVGL